MTTDDLIDLPHVVIVETKSDLRIAEFERGAEGQRQAHFFAEQQTGKPGVQRVLVTARYRSLGDAAAILRQP